MDLELCATEVAIIEACQKLLTAHAGPARAKQLVIERAADRRLGEALRTAGYLDLFHAVDAGPAAAALVCETVAEHAGLVPIGARVLVAPAVCEADDLPDIVAIADASDTTAVRFGEQADALLLLDGDEARLLSTQDWDATPLASKYGYPLARLEIRGRGRKLASGSAEVARRWWQVALASEIAGTARAAVSLTTRYVKEREQFGKPLGANQALAHRLVECAVQVEGVRWMSRQAACLDATDWAAGTAAVAAASAARMVTQETHQLTGAMGFTLEYDLHVWSLRLQTLRVEGGGIAAHADALVDARWPG